MTSVVIFRNFMFRNFEKFHRGIIDSLNGNYMRCVYSLFYEKIEQYIGSVFLINKLNLSKLFNSFDKEDKHGEVV